jgi:hypothetical protein
MNKLSRFTGYGIEDDEVVEGVEIPEDQEMDLREKVSNLDNEINVKEEDKETINAAMECLRELSASIENIVSEGRATQETSRMADISLKAILAPLGIEHNIKSLESFSGDHIEHLTTTQEGIFNYLKRMTTGKILVDIEAQDNLINLFMTNTAILKNNISKIDKLESRIKDMVVGLNERIDFSMSGAAKFFITDNTGNLPNFNNDIKLTRYVLETYPKKLGDQIKKIESLIKSGKDISDVSTPAEIFDSSLLDKTYFGQFVPRESKSKGYIVYENNKSLIDYIFNYPGQHVSKEIGITGKEMIDILQNCKEIALLGLKASGSLIENYKANLNKIKDIINRNNADHSAITVLESYGEAYMRPAKDEIKRVVKITDKSIIMIRVAIL